MQGVYSLPFAQVLKVDCGHPWSHPWSFLESSFNAGRLFLTFRTSSQGRLWSPLTVTLNEKIRGHRQKTDGSKQATALHGFKKTVQKRNLLSLNLFPLLFSLIHIPALGLIDVLLYLNRSSSSIISLQIYGFRFGQI